MESSINNSGKKKVTKIEQRINISVKNKELFHAFIEKHVRQWFMGREFGKVEINCKDGIIKISRTDWIN
jgi:hypothetical protein